MFSIEDVAPEEGVVVGVGGGWRWMDHGGLKERKGEGERVKEREGEGERVKEREGEGERVKEREME